MARAMNRFARMTSLVLAATLAAPAPAVAQKSPRERSALSRDAYDAGKKFYNLGDFERAIELWKQGYEYKDDPIFLFNIAQAYRQKGDYQKAIFFYKAYTREEPRARNRADVEARIGELTRLIEAQQNATEAPPREPVSPPEPPAEPAPLPIAPTEPGPSQPQSVHDQGSSRPGRSFKIAGAVTGGAGVAAAAAGVVFLLRSSSIESELEDRAMTGEPWSAVLVDRESQGRTAEVIGWIGVGAGAALLATGVTLFVLGMRKDARAHGDSEVTLTPLPVDSGGGVSATFSF